jgi:hypothetical protein
VDPPDARSAALLISVYIDTEGGAPWYAQLRAFTDPTAPHFRTQRTSDMDQLLLTVREWLETIIAGGDSPLTRP